MTRLLAMIREGYLVQERRLLAYLVATGRRDQASFDQWKRALDVDATPQPTASH